MTYVEIILQYWITQIKIEKLVKKKIKFMINGKIGNRRTKNRTNRKRENIKCINIYIKTKKLTKLISS